jgi:transcriptional regulator with XRE-family HTH domain
MIESHRRRKDNMNLETIRKRKGLTQCELADKLGVSKSYISHLESGRRQMGLDLLRKYAGVMSMRPEEILRALDLTQRSAIGERDLAMKVFRIVKQVMSKKNVSEKVSYGRHSSDR